METSRIEKLQIARLAFLALVIFGLAALAIRTVIYPNGKETYCQNDDAGNKHCAAYDANAVLLRQIGKAIEDYNGAITALSGVAVAGFTGTLWWVTRRSVRATEVAAKAARDSVDHARRSFIAENRAYVSPDFFQIRHVMFKDRVVAWRFAPRWKNTGSTPAVNIQHHTNFIIAGGGIPQNYDYPDTNIATRRGYGHPIGGGFHTDGYTEVFTADRLHAEQINRRDKIFSFGWIEYDDVFGSERRYRSEYCVQIINAGSWLDHTTNLNNLIKIVVVGPFNGMDGGCWHQPKTPHGKI